MQTTHSHPSPRGGHPAPHHATHANPEGRALDRIALVATLHCLTGCAIGEIAGMVLGAALGWSRGQTIALAVTLAFVSGFAMTMVPFLRRGYRVGAAMRIALAADTASIAVMELVDNAAMLVIPGAMDAGLESPVFWGSLAVSLGLAAAAAWPVNRWLIARGRGHALAHCHH